VLFADRESDIAASRDLATKSSALLRADAGLALAIAQEALDRSDTAQARAALRQAALEYRVTRVVGAGDGLLYGLATRLDGRVAATAGADRTVSIWSLSSARRIGRVGGFRAAVRAVSFSRDGRRIAIAAQDGEISVAPAGGGQREVLMRLPDKDFARSVDFDAGGDRLAIATQQGWVALIGLSDRKVRELAARDGVRAHVVSFDRAARNVVSGNDHGTARIWSLDGGPLRTLPHSGAVVVATFHPSGAQLATADAAGGVRRWDASSGRELAKLPIAKQVVTSVRFSRDGRRIVTATFDGVVRESAYPSGKLLGELTGHQGVARADFAAGDNRLVSAGEDDRSVRIWASPAATLPRHPGVEPRFGPKDELVVSGDENGPIHVWNPATGEEHAYTGHEAPSFARFAANGRWIVSASFDGTVRLRDVQSGVSAGEVKTLPGAKYAVGIDPAGKRIAVGGDTKLVVQGADGKDRVELRGHKGLVNALAFSPDGKHLVTGGDDGTARIWNADDGAPGRVLRGHEVAIAVAYSDDGDFIAVAGSDSSVRIWPVGGGKPVILNGHLGPVNSVAFDHGGDRLVTAGEDGTIRVWDTSGGDALVLLHRHEGRATGADISENGRRVVSSGADGMRITTCEVCGSFEEALRVARARAPHELTAAERQRLLSGD
jgi:WD40 repeat protein